MKLRERSPFNPTALFLVTGFCCIIFSQLIKFLEGTHFLFFLRAGIIVSGLGILSWLLSLIAGMTGTNKHNLES